MRCAQAQADLAETFRRQLNGYTGSMGAALNAIKESVMGDDGFRTDPWERVPWWHGRRWLGQYWRRWVWDERSMSGRYDGNWEYQTNYQRAMDILKEKCNGEAVTTHRRFNFRR